jgi:hypothetical protein
VRKKEKQQRGFAHEKSVRENKVFGSVIEMQCNYLPIFIAIQHAKRAFVEFICPNRCSGK